MANANAPFGFRVAKPSDGSIRESTYPIASGYGTAIFYGDLVKTAAGFINVVSGTSDIILGVFAGCVYTNSTTGQPTWSNQWVAATTDTTTQRDDGTLGPYALVYDDPLLELLVQDVGATVAANIFKNCAVDFSVGGSTTTGLSGQMAASSYVTSTAQLKILGLHTVANNAFGTNNILRVQINPAFHFRLQTLGA